MHAVKVQPQKQEWVGGMHLAEKRQQHQRLLTWNVLSGVTAVQTLWQSGFERGGRPVGGKQHIWEWQWMVSLAWLLSS